MTLINGNSSSDTYSYADEYCSTIEEVILPKEKKTHKIKTFALTHVGNYVVSTIQKYDDWYETQIILNSVFEENKIGYYVKKSNNSKTALNQHIEAIWHVNHSCREGL